MAATGLLAVTLATSLHAQSTPPAVREYRPMRFDEEWSSADRSPHWADAIKAIPIASRPQIRVSLGGQVRWRDEGVRAFNLSPQHDEHAQSRVLLHGELLAGARTRAHVRGFIEARDAQSYGRSLPGGVRATDADRHDIQNAFVEAAWGRSFLRHGRQEIATNRERLIGVPDWANTRRGSTGTRVQLVSRRFTIEAMDFRPLVVRHTASNFGDSAARVRTLSVGSAGGAPRLAPFAPTIWQLFRYEQSLGASNITTTRRTYGARAQWQWGNAKARRYSLEVEQALQRGRREADTIDASMLVVESSVQVAHWSGKPTFAIGFEWASGEQRNTTGRRELFTVLYPAAHAHGGFADVIGRPNVREWHWITTWDPTPALTLRSALYRFDRHDLGDGVYTKQTTVFRAADGSRARHVADELDVTASWKLTRHLRAIAGGALVVPGAFLRTSSLTNQTEQWAFLGTTFTF
ncbi:MAG: alginate export family protein [Gemmatimonadaceae bacterium]|nr:alginate export family protein [Gemmatimonadaceae bacterium]